MIFIINNLASIKINVKFFEIDYFNIYLLYIRDNRTIILNTIKNILIYYIYFKVKQVK